MIAVLRNLGKNNTRGLDGAAVRILIVTAFQLWPSLCVFFKNHYAVVFYLMIQNKLISYECISEVRNPTSKTIVQSHCFHISLKYWNANRLVLGQSCVTQLIGVFE